MQVKMRWDPMTHTDYDLLKGRPVFSVDGEKVGTIDAVLHPNTNMPAARGQHYFLLDSRWIEDWVGGSGQVYCPEAAIDRVSTDRVVLSLTADEVQQCRQDWTTEPLGLATYERI